MQGHCCCDGTVPASSHFQLAAPELATAVQLHVALGSLPCLPTLGLVAAPQHCRRVAAPQHRMRTDGGGDATSELDASELVTAQQVR